MNGQDGTFNAIWAGWYVYPDLAGDFRARLHVAWEDPNNPDCYDLFCAGFLQVSSKIAPGVRLLPVSTYNGPQYQMTILLYKDPKTKNWWLVFGNGMQPVGYWPDSLFSSLSGEASRLVWGGSIKTSPWLPSPPMGSGHFPSEGFGKAAYIYDIKIVDDHNTLRIPNSRFFTPHVNENVCYDVAGLTDGNDGVGFYYGGPGGCNL
ncbi:hypothetical protein LUZ62_026599 [Rhynchospora pubera]|uniref:Neprosin PEP catalytic domain-containing protein n=1 Tax=Rhynchospora pubera TaxID=906938 RepID=A0AAV8H881_9POAL|nr:hypothetical protein LUZ62_026599 [Rhynchospora pubera]